MNTGPDHDALIAEDTSPKLGEWDQATANEIADMLRGLAALWQARARGARRLGSTQDEAAANAVAADCENTASSLTRKTWANWRDHQSFALKALVKAGLAVP